MGINTIAGAVTAETIRPMTAGETPYTVASVSRIGETKLVPRTITSSAIRRSRKRVSLRISALLPNNNCETADTANQSWVTLSD
jgi:hypothetical protein